MGLMRPIGNRAPTTNAQTASAQVSAEMADRAYMACTARVLNALRGAFECGLTDKCMGRGFAWPIHVDGGSAFRISGI